MDVFLGKWTEIKEDVESYRQFIEKMGVPKETAEKILKYRGFFELKEDGELFKAITGYVEDPSLNKTYNFKMNETFTDTDNFGQKFTLVCKVEDGKWYDKCTNYYNQATIESVREVVGDTLIVTTTCDGQTMVSKFKK
ncbi:Hypothetical predicted protein [Octopus vulgaris]|uniref:Uncharacterized protein n=2 Tax=Octopus TaxID=6643 RepID=A0AA36BSK0_OCTVU|nr:gastrotropin [Octopus sinensis]CAI9739554.1 Hypothetical predicted protein [Octopus vulgaris]